VIAFGREGVEGGGARCVRYVWTIGQFAA